MNYINYLSHKVFEPLYYQRRYENDLPKTQTKWIDATKRVALIALPFISLHKPIGQCISIGMGSIRSFSHLSDAIKAGYHKDFLSLTKHFVLTALAVTSVAGSFFKFEIGLLVTTAVDMGTSLTRAIQHLKQKEYSQAIEELFQAISSLIYLGILLNGSLEMTLASVLMQGILSLYQARSEWKQGRVPEAIAKIAMGMIRFNQGREYLQLIQKRNAFLSLEKFSKLIEKIQKGRETEHLIDSDLNGQKEEVILVDAEGNPYNAGSNEHGYGSGTVKGMNLRFHVTVIDGKTMKTVDFKVNHVFRNQLQTLINGMHQFSSQEMKDFLVLNQSHAKGLKIEEVPFVLSHETNKSVGTAYKITLDGLGSLVVGNSKQFPNLFDRVRIEMDENKSLYECHELLSFFDLDGAIRLSSEEDIERLKIGQLFRIFYPKEATLLERQDRFFTLSVEQLKQEMIKQVPQMQSLLDKHLPTMEKVEILPGRVRYAVPELANMAYNLGGRALVSTLTGSVSDDEMFVRLASILKMGMLASEERYSDGMVVSGLSSSGDFYTGGADSVFTQFLTEKNFNEKMSLNNLYWGKVRILFSLDALNTGTYQYHEDSYGVRRVDETQSYWSDRRYLNRPDILSFVKREGKGFNFGNEVMVKERIDPSLITGIILPDETTKARVVDCLRKHGVVNIKDGIESILGIPLNNFIHVGQNLSAEMVS